MTRRDAGDVAVAGAIIAASTQPATSVSTGGITRREIMAAGTGADGETRMRSFDTKMRQDGTIAAGAAGSASPLPAGSAAAAAILGGDVGNVTAAGAVAAPTARRDARPMIILQEEPPAAQQQPSGQASFQKARIECLEARGYTAQ